MSENTVPENKEEGYEPDLLTLEDEAGQEHVFEVIDATDIGEERYLAMAPYFPEPDAELAEDTTLLFMRVVEQNGEEFLDIVEEQQELDMVLEVFYNRLSELYDLDLEDLLEDN